MQDVHRRDNFKHQMLCCELALIADGLEDDFIHSHLVLRLPEDFAQSSLVAVADADFIDLLQHSDPLGREFVLPTALRHLTIINDYECRLLDDFSVARQRNPKQALRDQWDEADEIPHHPKRAKTIFDSSKVLFPARHKECEPWNGNCSRQNCNTYTGNA